jgi:hypothetical protein
VEKGKNVPTDWKFIETTQTSPSMSSKKKKENSQNDLFFQQFPPVLFETYDCQVL